MIAKILLCDLCSAEGLPNCGRATMHEYGWHVAGRDGPTDLCPRCVKFKGDLMDSGWGQGDPK